MNIQTLISTVESTAVGETRMGSVNTNPRAGRLDELLRCQSSFAILLSDGADGYGSGFGLAEHG